MASELKSKVDGLRLEDCWKAARTSPRQGWISLLAPTLVVPSPRTRWRRSLREFSQGLRGGADNRRAVGRGIDAR